MSERTSSIVAGVATIAFPVLLLVGFALHPHLFEPRMTLSAEDLAIKFRGQAAFHVGHLLVFAAVPFIILHFAYVQGLLTGRGRAWGFWGGIIGIVGAVILAGDKGALCIVLSAFDSLPDADFAAIRPALQAIVERRGELALFWALPLLPIGAIVQAIGMMREGAMTRAAGVLAIVGLALLNNPDIDIVSSAGALLMCCSYIPLGVRMLGRGA
jgi:hypothetical protein